MELLFFYPENLEIITRRIYYSHTSGILKRNVRENLIFKNSSEDNLYEIILEIENFKTNLKIIDSDGSDLIYLPNYEIANMKEKIPDDILSKINETDTNERTYILAIEFKNPVKAGEYHTIDLDYIQYSKKHKKVDIKYNRHFLYENVQYFDIISFYGKETLSIFSNWESGLEVHNYDYYPAVAGYAQLILNQDRSFIQLKSNEIYLKKNKNCFSMSISYQYRNQIKDLDFISIFYIITPEMQQIRLMQVLTIFTFAIPFTFFISIMFNNISYLFDSLEIESVFILTVAFAQTKTRLISHENHIKLALILAGLLFILVLIQFIWFKFL